VAVASAGPYANHIAPENNHASTPPLFFTGRMPFLPPNQQRRSTEGDLQQLLRIGINDKTKYSKTTCQKM